MKKRFALLFIILAAVGIMNSCSDDFLEIKPNGALDRGVLANKDGVDKLLIAAYSLLDGNSSQFSFDSWDANMSNWLWGSVRGLEANKGSDAGDQAEMNAIQSFTEDGTNAKINNKWRFLYEGVSRCNAVVSTAALAVTGGKMTQAEADVYINQAKTLRGYYHFEAWRMWGGAIPYLDELTDPATVTNTEDVRAKILADLEAGTALPNNMTQIGRFNGTVARVLYAKALMQMNKDYDNAITQLKWVETNGTKPDGSAIGLAPTYGEIFDVENRNGLESIYTVQYSVNDGSGGDNGGDAEVLNFPYKGNNGSPAGCCGFFIPNQEFVNTFRTSAGLPLANYQYNVGANQVKNDQGLVPADAFVEDAGELDPRLDWSVGRRGIPYWDWGVHTGSDWIRDQSYSGPYSPKKQVYKASQAGAYTEIGGWTSGWTANGYRMIRFADVLLMIAECDIFKGTPDLAEAQTYINRVRARAANPAGFVKEADGTTNAANYVINQYTVAFASVAEAAYALRIERVLELGQEGHRYFDLNRWGIAIEELNRVLTYQKSLSWGDALYGNATIGNEDVSYPVPQRQIDLSLGKLVSNR